MNKKYATPLELVLVFLSACHEIKMDPLVKILSTLPSRFDSLLTEIKLYCLHIIYTQTHRDSLNRPVFHTFSCGMNPSQYFYPASTVKLSVAALTLEWLADHNISGMDKTTLFRIDSSSAENRDSLNTLIHGYTTVDQCIRKLFLVSDNYAFNQLSELMGKEHINRTLHEKGHLQTRIVYRLSVPLSPEENRRTHSITFFAAGETQFTKSAMYNQQQYHQPMLATRIGEAFFRDDSLVSVPMEFAQKNVFPLEEQLRMLQRLMFPDANTDSKIFFFPPEEYICLWSSMSTFSGESTNPPYDTTQYYDSYVKFFMFGTSDHSIPGNIRIFNKAGVAYGFVIGNAYFVDFDHKIEFLISAVVYVNNNGILNDGYYQYVEVGWPFMASLGKAVYRFALNRHRGYTPNLS